MNSRDYRKLEKTIQMIFEFVIKLAIYCEEIPNRSRFH